MGLRPIASAGGMRLLVLIAALTLLVLALACNRGEPPTPTPDTDALIAEAVATAVAAVMATPEPAPGPTLSPEEADRIAKINADAAALSAAVELAVEEYYNGRLRGDLEGAIAYAASETGADPAAVARAMAEITGTVPLLTAVDPAAKDLSDALATAVTFALQYLISAPLDREGAVAHAVSMTGADTGAVADWLNRVLNNPTGFPNVDAAIAVAAANALSEAGALADSRFQAEATVAATQGTITAIQATAQARQNPTPTPGYTPPPVRRYDAWNDDEWLAEPKPWWRASNPYACDPAPNPSSPWTAAGLPDLGGQDPLSLIRYFGNGSYIRYGLMGFEGCALMSRHPERTHLDIPVDPAYYSLGDLEIAVDIARVPVGAADWPSDNGARVDMSMADAVKALNDNVAAYFRKISQGKLQMNFVAGHEFQASGRATPQEVRDQWLALIGITGCDPDDPNRVGCPLGMPGALNRIIFDDVAASSGGSAWNGYADLGLVSVQHATMPTLIHEIGHSWMLWPHSYIELAWRPNPQGGYQRPNFYSNVFDVMSELTPARPSGWHQDMPATLAVNRYAAGWIEPQQVALHLTDQATYTLARPRQSGNQFLVIHSGRPGAFTTLEVLDERNAVYRDTYAVVFDPASPGGKRPRRYEGVLVSRYDQTTGTGVNARVGPALYNAANPNYATDVGFGRDDYSVIADGESRSIGGGLSVSVSKNADGGYEVRVSGGKIAEFEPWCVPIWFSGEYDTGCLLDGQL